MSETNHISFQMKPSVFQVNKEWFVSFVAIDKNANPLTHYTERRKDHKFKRFEDAVVYAGYLQSTRRDGIKEFDIPLVGLTGE